MGETLVQLSELGSKQMPLQLVTVCLPGATGSCVLVRVKLP